jgi:uncharacterized membrane protein YraQ (UPF0718 family)/copper chaperone CopZ
VLDISYHIFQESVGLWLAMAPYILLGMFFAGILHAFLGEGFIARHLGGKGMKSLFKATLFGIPLPICSCGVIPVAASLKKEGASKSSVLSFLVSTPTTGVDSILATYALLGPLFAIFRPVAALFNGLIVGLFNRIFNPERETVPPVRPPRPVKTQFRIKETFRYGFVELAQDIGKWLVIGVLLGGILTVAIPESLLTQHVTQPALHFVILLAFAIPLYVCATGSIPIAAALIGKGFTPGAALVFLIAGPATNTVTISFVYSKLGKRAFSIYLVVIILVSLFMGWMFNIVWRALGGNVGLVMPHGQALPPTLTAMSGILLLGLIVKGFLPKKGVKGEIPEMNYTLTVPGMTCNHCRMTVEDAVKRIPGVEQVTVNLETKMVGIDGEPNIEDVKKGIRDAGYEIEE